jgi:hypothetical protein
VTDEPLRVPSTAALSLAQVVTLSVQSASKADPGPLVKWPAGHPRQEVEPEVGWYLEAGQATHASWNAPMTVMSLCATQAPPSWASQVAVIKSGVAAVSTALNQQVAAV